jgi:hypothetical protein
MPRGARICCSSPTRPCIWSRSKRSTSARDKGCTATRLQLLLRGALLPLAGDQRSGQLAQEAGAALRRGGGLHRPQRPEDQRLERARRYRPWPHLQHALPGLQDQPWRARCALSGRGQRHRRVPRHRHQHLGPEDTAEPALGRGPHQRPPPDDVHGGSHLGILPLRGVRAEPSPRPGVPSAA